MEKYFLDASLKIGRILPEIMLGGVYYIGDRFKVYSTVEESSRSDLNIIDIKTSFNYAFGMQFLDNTHQSLKIIDCLTCVSDTKTCECIYRDYSETFGSFYYDYRKDVLFPGEGNSINATWSCSTGQIKDIWTMYKNFDVFYLKSYDYKRFIQKNPGDDKTVVDTDVPIDLYPLELIRDQEALLNNRYKVEWYLSEISTINRTLAMCCLDLLDNFSAYIELHPVFDYIGDFNS